MICRCDHAEGEHEERPLNDRGPCILCNCNWYFCLACRDSYGTIQWGYGEGEIPPGTMVVSSCDEHIFDWMMNINLRGLEELTIQEILQKAQVVIMPV